MTFIVVKIEKLQDPCPFPHYVRITARITLGEAYLTIQRMCPEPFIQGELVSMKDQIREIIWGKIDEDFSYLVSKPCKPEFELSVVNGLPPINRTVSSAGSNIADINSITTKSKIEQQLTLF